MSREKPESEDVGSHGAVGVGLVERLLQPLEPEGELAAEVDEGLGHLEGVGRDEHALEDLVRVALNEQVVLEGGRLGLVAVDHEVGDRVLAQHRPLAPGREAGAAPAEQAGRVDLGRHRLGGHGQRLAQRLVAARGQVALQRVGVVEAQARRDDLGSVRDGHQALSPPAAAARAAWASAMLGPLADDGLLVGLEADAAAHPDQGPVRRHGVGQRAGPEVGDQLVEALGRLPADVAVVDLHAGRAVAVGQALGLFEREDAVGRGAARVDPERGLGVLEQLEGTAEHAGDVGAHRDDVGADRLGEEHVVEGGRAPHLGRRHAAELGDLLHGLGAEPAVLLLGQVAQRDEGRAPLGVEGDERLGPLGDLGVQMAHRSTSPITGSTEEMTATASAMRPPRSKSGSACRLTKLGPRMCMR